MTRFRIYSVHLHNTSRYACLLIHLCIVQYVPVTHISLFIIIFPQVFSINFVWPFFLSFFLSFIFSSSLAPKTFWILLHWICVYNPIMGATNQKYCTKIRHIKKVQKKFLKALPAFIQFCRVKQFQFFRYLIYIPPPNANNDIHCNKIRRLCVCVWNMCFVIVWILLKSGKRENSREDAFLHKRVGNKSVNKRMNIKRERRKTEKQQHAVTVERDVEENLDVERKKRQTKWNSIKKMSYMWSKFKYITYQESMMIPGNVSESGNFSI